MLSQYQSSSQTRTHIDIKGQKREGGWDVEVGRWTGGECSAQVLAVWFEEKPEDVRILRGENKGVTLPHRNVVRDLTVLGSYRGGEERFEVRERRGLRIVVLVQEGRGGKIVGAVCLR